MTPQMLNPGLAPRALRDLLCVGWSRSPHTACDFLAQILASRFAFSPWLANDVAMLCFGERRSHD